MNNYVRDFAAKHADKLRGKVVEVGSRNINGSVKDIIPHRIGTDMCCGAEVDIICEAKDLLDHFWPESVDAVMSFDCFEHIQEWRESLTAMWGILKPGGWLVMTMASPKKGRHAYPDDYWRAEWSHILQIFPEADDMGSWGPSMGFVVQKRGELPDLSKIELIAVP